MEERNVWLAEDIAEYRNFIQVWKDKRGEMHLHIMYSHNTTKVCLHVLFVHRWY